MILHKTSSIKMPHLSVHSVTRVLLQCCFFGIIGLVSGQGSIQYQSNPQDASPYVVNPPVEIVPYYNANPYQYQQQQQHGQGQFGIKNVQSSNYHNVQPLYFTTSQNTVPTQTQQQQNSAQPLSQIPDTYNPNFNFAVNDVNGNMNLAGNFNTNNIKNNNNIHIIPALTTEYTNPSQPAGLPLYQNVQNQNPNENLITQQNAYYQYPSNVNTLIQNSQPLNQNNVQNIVPIQPQFTTQNNPPSNPINTNYYVNPGVTTTYAHNNNNNNVFGLGNVQTTRTYFGNFNTNTNNNNNNNNIVNSGLQFGPTAFSTAPSTNFGGTVQDYQQYTLNPYVPSAVSSAYNYGLTSSGEQFGFSSSSSGNSGPSGFPASASSNTATVIETFKALDKTQEFQKSLHKNVNSVIPQQQQQQQVEKPKKVSSGIENGFSNLISITKSNNNNNVQRYTKEKQAILPKNNTNNTFTTTTNTKSSQRQNNKNNYKTKEVAYSTKILVNNFTPRSGLTSTTTATTSTTTTTTTPKPITKTPTTTENIKTTTESLVFGRRLKPIKSLRNRSKSIFNIASQNDDDDTST